ncbi:TauD/TfdA family dioxygenase [Catenulispora yoronensis]|uniref:TauD/TfdA family dioxygenase n=1 Tax=Catenulispora yoronensis TaxID=450799 RepID=A0ABN2UVT7_9ACTN
MRGLEQGNGWTTALEFAPPGGVSLRWVEDNKSQLTHELQIHGAVVLRGLAGGVDEFGDVVSALGGPQLSYTERSTPRSSVKGNVYTSTEYPASQEIPMHNENSYSDSWPGYLYFLCEVAPATGGCTPIADSRQVLENLPGDVRDRFDGGVVYTRNYREGLGLTWQEAYQTSDQQAVERYCREHGMDAVWADGELRTDALRPATRVAPSSDQEVWFNQANLFHPSTLDPEVREALLELYDESELPRNAHFSDGSPIPEADIEAVTKSYRKVALELPWQAGSVLIIDNMRMAHGRSAFTGDRRVLVAMT